MAETTTTAMSEYLRKVSLDAANPYDLWMNSLGVPVHTGYFIDDVRTIELGWWEERKCNAAFLKLAGQEGVTEARVTEIPAGQTLPPVKFSLDEIVYVADGHGLTTVQNADGTSRTFEWQKHSLFMLPRNSTSQFSNVRGSEPARLLHYNYLPSAMSIVPDPDFYFNNPYSSGSTLDGEFYSEAKVSIPSDESRDTGLSRGMAYWMGNFFPDMRAWDQLVPFKGRGAGGHVVWIRYPGATMTNHMSVFPAQTYKKAHRHGPGVVIIIPGGEGFSVMWPEGQDKVFIPWHEGSVFVPPNRWFHQHFNVGENNGRYLAFHAPRNMSSNWERVEDRQRDQIEYPDEDPWIRKTFEEQLAQRGLETKMLEQAYKDRNFEWDYDE